MDSQSPPTTHINRKRERQAQNWYKYEELNEIDEMHAKRTSMPTHKLLNIENMNPEQPVGLYVNCYAGGGQYSLLCK